MIRKKDGTSKLAPIAISYIFMGYSRYQPGRVMIWVPNDTSERYRVVVYSIKCDEETVYKDAGRHGKEI